METETVVRDAIAMLVLGADVAQEDVLASVWIHRVAGVCLFVCLFVVVAFVVCHCCFLYVFSHCAPSIFSGTSIPGFCPGAHNIQCCVHTPPQTTSSTQSKSGTRRTSSHSSTSTGGGDGRCVANGISGLCVSTSQCG
jgi:hypothetical protein